MFSEFVKRIRFELPVILSMKLITNRDTLTTKPSVYMQVLFVNLI